MKIGFKRQFWIREMHNFRQFFSEKYTFFDKIAYPILRKMCFLQQKSDKITRASLSKTGVLRVKWTNFILVKQI